MYEVFISHSRASSFEAAVIGDILSDILGENTVFRPNRNLRAGERWSEAIERVLGQAAAVLALIDPAWPADLKDKRSNSNWLEFELQAAFRNNVPIVPVLLDGVEGFSTKTLPHELDFLAKRQEVRFSRSEPYDGAARLARLVHVLSPERVPLPRIDHPDFESAQALALDLPSFTEGEIKKRGVEPKKLNLIKLSSPEGTPRFPAFQFDEDGNPISLVVHINQILNAEDDPWGVVDWWIGPNAWLDQKPISLLNSADEVRLLAAAEAVGEVE
jgi:hypothetical protein